MTSGYPGVDAADLPWLTVGQMEEADRLAVHVFGIDLLQMMEHARAALARLTDDLAPPGEVSMLAGGGNNGGGGLCAARHLLNRGREVEIVLASERRSPAVEHHLATLAEMGITPVEVPSGRRVAVDALVGYGLDGALRGKAADLAGAIRGSFVVSLDIPSGHGNVGAVVPDATLTLALPKVHIRDLRPLFLADLGLPEALWGRMGLAVGSVFSDGSIVEVTA